MRLLPQTGYALLRISILQASALSCGTLPVRTELRNDNMTPALSKRDRRGEDDR
jgi:hypothetical protein